MSRSQVNRRVTERVRALRASYVRGDLAHLGDILGRWLAWLAKIQRILNGR